jgi:hypothetical protein
MHVRFEFGKRGSGDSKEVDHVHVKTIELDEDAAGTVSRLAQLGGPEDIWRLGVQYAPSGICILHQRDAVYRYSRVDEALYQQQQRRHRTHKSEPRPIEPMIVSQKSLAQSDAISPNGSCGLFLLQNIFSLSTADLKAGKIQATFDTSVMLGMISVIETEAAAAKRGLSESLQQKLSGARSNYSTKGTGVFLGREMWLSIFDLYECMDFLNVRSKVFLWEQTGKYENYEISYKLYDNYCSEDEYRFGLNAFVPLLYMYLLMGLYIITM